MQIKTIHKLQYALNTSVKILKFVWRHLLVFGAIGLTIQVICEGYIPNLKGTLFVLAISIFVDWFKMQFKASGNNDNLAQDQMFESARRSRDDFSWRMNPMNPLNPMGYTYHTSNYTSNYY